MNWEQIDAYHQRAKVLGGWLVKAFQDVSIYTEHAGMQSGWDFTACMSFVPDANHEWKLEEAK